MDFDFIPKAFASPPIVGLRALAAMRWGRYMVNPGLEIPQSLLVAGHLGSFRNSIMGVEIFTPDNPSSCTL
jgi:hypothetical protein